MNDNEDYTPSLLAGLLRYRIQVAVVVVVFGLIGALFAWSTWKPEAVMKVNVQVTSGSAAVNGNDADRITSEVANLMSSPQVLDATVTASGVTVDEILTSWTQGESTVGVRIESSSPESAETAAGSLLASFEKVRSDQIAAQVAPQIEQLNSTIARLDAELAVNLAAMGAATDPSATLTRLQAERQSLGTERSTAASALAAAQLAAVTPPATVTIASGPDAGAGRVSLLIRYVPAAMVAGLLLSMVVVAVVERRRPWVTAPTDAARLLQAPLLGVGPRGSQRATGAHGRDQVYPVVAMSTLRAVGNAPTGIVLLIPRGAAEVGDGSIRLARDMTPVLERAGAKVAVLAVAASGRAFLLRPEGVEEELANLWSEFTGREEFEATLRQSGVDADLIVLVPVVDVEHDVLLDLILLADVSVVSVRTGELLEPLVTLRRDFDALGREPHGVVADLAVR